MRNQNDDFMALYEKSLKDIREGSVIEGEVVQIQDEYVLVDIGYKTEGRIPLAEFSDSGGNVNVRVGDGIKATVSAVHPDERKIWLTMRRPRQPVIQADKGSTAKNGGKVASNLGELLKSEMETKSNNRNKKVAETFSFYREL